MPTSLSSSLNPPGASLNEPKIPEGTERFGSLPLTILLFESYIGCVGTNSLLKSSARVMVLKSSTIMVDAPPSLKLVGRKKFWPPSE
ncbi:hypothetical protein D3C85_1076520 [compost metagenome]